MNDVNRFRINHTTTYQYEEAINSCVMMFCLQPRNHLQQSLIEFNLKVTPNAQFSIEFDAFGNRHHFCDIQHEHERLDIEVTALVEHQDGFNETQPDPRGWSRLDELAEDWDMWEFLRFTELTQPSQLISAWLAEFDIQANETPLTRLQRLSQHIQGTFSYVPGATHVDSTVDQFLEKGQGVCQDYVHLMLSAVRSWGVPARYVSGYLFAASPEKYPTANAMHAWVECWIPGVGWVSFDPTNASSKSTVLIPVAMGRDYKDVVPSRGITLGGGQSELSVGVSVLREPSDLKARRDQSLMMQQ